MKEQRGKEGRRELKRRGAEREGKGVNNEKREGKGRKEERESEEKREKGKERREEGRREKWKVRRGGKGRRDRTWKMGDRG